VAAQVPALTRITHGLEQRPGGTRSRREGQRHARRPPGRLLPAALRRLACLILLLPGAALAASPVCERTSQVRDAIAWSLFQQDLRTNYPRRRGTITKHEMRYRYGIDDAKGLRRYPCTRITPEHLAGIERLSLLSTGATSLHKHDFAGMHNLKALSLRNNALQHLPPGLFAPLDKLESLDLSLNDFTHLPPDTFTDLRHLRYLELDGNDLQQLTPGLFAGLDLHYLNLAHNDLEALPPGVFAGLGNLESLDVSWNALQTLPPGIFDDLGGLRYLSLHTNVLRSLPTGTFAGLRELYSLSLRGNALESLPTDAFPNLDNLDHLDLRNNPCTRCRRASSTTCTPCPNGS